MIARGATGRERLSLELHYFWSETHIRFSALKEDRWDDSPISD